jgi:hypothetical protein
MRRVLLRLSRENRKLQWLAPPANVGLRNRDQKSLGRLHPYHASKYLALITGHVPNFGHIEASFMSSHRFVGSTSMMQKFGNGAQTNKSTRLDSAIEYAIGFLTGA